MAKTFKKLTMSWIKNPQMLTDHSREYKTPTDTVAEIGGNEHRVQN